MGNLVAIDGSYIVHKSFHRANENVSRDNFSSDSEYTMALVAKTYEMVLQTTTKVILDVQAASVLILLDIPCDREMINCLKTKSEVDDKYVIINRVKDSIIKLFPTGGLGILKLAGVEADTIGYWISKLDQRELKELFGVYEDRTYELILVTADTDWEISIGETTSLYNPLTAGTTEVEDMKKWSGHEWYRESFISHRCLTSNKDGIIGVPGVGSKGSTAIRDLLYDRETRRPRFPEGNYGHLKGRDLSAMKKVISNWDHFVALWHVVDQDWIYKLDYYGACTVSEVLYVVASANDSFKNVSSENVTAFDIAQITKPAGSTAKLTPAIRRLENYLSTRRLMNQMKV